MNLRLVYSHGKMIKYVFNKSRQIILIPRKGQPCSKSKKVDTSTKPKKETRKKEIQSQNNYDHITETGHWAPWDIVALTKLSR